MKLITEEQALRLLQMTKAELDARVNAGSLTAYPTAMGLCFDESQVEHYAATRLLLQKPTSNACTTEYTDDEGKTRRTRRIVWDD